MRARPWQLASGLLVWLCSCGPKPPVRTALQGDLATLKLDIARRPSRSPDWEHADARDHAMLRKFTDDLKKRVARWADARSDD